MKKLSLIFTIIISSVFVWVGVDLVNNASFTKLPAQSPVKLQMRENQALYALQHNQTFDFSLLADTYTKINARYDTSDFRTPSLIRILYDHQEKIPEYALAEMKNSLLNFKYWMDQPGQDSMCFWSENHQILFASAEYLLGQLLPEEIFTNDGKTGKEHQAMARARILTWLEQRWLFGFTEWYSNTYYTEDIAPLINLIDYADEEVSLKSQIILDLLLHDIATQSYKGTFIASSGRMYERGKRDGDRNSLNRLIEHLWGDRYHYGEEKGMLQGFMYSHKYQMPEVIKTIGLDESEQVIKATNGLNLSELASENLIGLHDNQIMMQWAMEAFTNPEVINNTVAYIAQNNMFSNQFLHDLKMVNIGLLKYTGLLSPISRLLKPVSDGVAIQRANTYTFKTPDYMLTSAQAYHPGTYGDQHHLWNATLSNKLSIFTTHPATIGASGNSPSYWVGYGIIPHVFQDKNIVVNLYNIPDEAGFMGKKPVHYTHAHFPSKHMDEVKIDGRFAFGRLDNKYVAFIGKNKLYYSKAEQSKEEHETQSSYDLIQDGANTYWIFEVSNQEKEQSFEHFIARIKANQVNYENNILTYQSQDKNVVVQYADKASVDGQVIDTEYKRFDSLYSQTERKAKTMKISHNEQTLYLDFYNLIREQR